jgi:hypothetical protein
VLERLGWRFIRVRSSEFFRDPERALVPLYEHLERMGIGPAINDAFPPDSQLSKRVIAEARRIRSEWEEEPEIIDEILGRTQPKQGLEIQAATLSEEEISAPVLGALQ